MPRPQTQRPPVKIDDQQDSRYEVQEIWDSQYVNRQLKYLVKWVGRDNATWEPCENVDDAEQTPTFTSLTLIIQD